MGYFSPARTRIRTEASRFVVEIVAEELPPEFDVVVTRLGDFRELVVGEWPGLRRNSVREVAFGDGLVVGDDGVCSDDTVRFDSRPTEDATPDSNERVVLNGRVIDDCAVTDAHTITNRRAVEHRELLDVRVRTNCDSAAVTTETDERPNTGTWADCHIAHEIREVCDERTLV